MRSGFPTRLFSTVLVIVLLLMPSDSLPCAARPPVAEPDAEPPATEWQLPAYQKAVLIELYNATNGPGWKNNTGWLGPQDPCYWYGVHCTNSAPYTTLRWLSLGNNGLAGPIPASLKNLDGLEMLYLGGNALTGEIPPELGQIPYLRHLGLDGNQLVGTIPSGLSSLSHLELLLLSSNHLTGPIPDWLGNLTSLTTLSLAGNDLVGSIPPTLANLKNLTSLWLGMNHLEGEMPAFLGELTKLQTLSLSFNRFTGPIPNLSALTNLTTLELANKPQESPGLSGPIPAWIGNLTKLTHLHLEGNSLEGPIPDSLRNLTRLEVLNLNNNRLTGQVPTWLGNLSNLKELSLCCNASAGNRGLTGAIPATLGSLGKLTVFDLSGNNLSGNIPDSILSLPELTNLYLARNNLEGDLPATAAATAGDVEGAAAGSKLQVIDVSYNKLTGIKLNWGAGTPVKSVNLRGNQIEQSIPAALFKIPTLEFIDLGDNQLEGHIPDVAALTNLKILKLDHNNLSGGIPFNIDALRKLEVLNLSYNALDRTLDLPATTVLPHLYFLDLSHNKLWREVPREIGLLTGLKTLRLNDNRFTGKIPSELGNLKSLEELDLSRNGFMGGFPACIGELTNLKHLAMRDIVPRNPEGPWETQDAGTSVADLFGGRLPETFGLLTKLQYLDLNGLYMTGPLPAGMADMTSLTHLDLGNNFFDGDVPDGFSRLTKLQYFDMHWTPYLNNTLPLANVVKMKQLTYCDLAFGPVVPGPIPLGIGDLKNLRTLELSGNGIEGEIPSRLGELGLLTILGLQDNDFVGEIPKEIGNLRALQVLNLGGNRLRGKIPTELGNLTELTYLNLGYNRVPEDPSSGLSGDAPEFLMHLDKVSTLILARNRFTGPMHFVGFMENLRYVDLSHNQFSDFIPCDLFRKGLEVAYLNNNLLTIAPSGFPELDHAGIRIVDLSMNRLTGQLGAVGCGVVRLNLSGNLLSGGLDGVAGINESCALEYLDVSGNVDMSGPLPIGLLKSREPRYINFGRTRICEPSDLGFQIALAAARLMGFTIISSGLKCAPPPAVSAQVGPSGGTLASPGDGTTYTFAPGTFGSVAYAAIASAAVVTVTHVPKDANAAPATGTLVGIRHFYDAYARDASGQYVQPQKPYTVTIQYGPIDLASSRARESTLALYRWNGTTWVREPTSRVDTEADTITANPTRFSTWAVLGEPAKIRLLPVIMKGDTEQ